MQYRRQVVNKATQPLSVHGQLWSFRYREGMSGHRCFSPTSCSSRSSDRGPQEGHCGPVSIKRTALTEMLLPLALYLKPRSHEVSHQFVEAVQAGNTTTWHFVSDAEALLACCMKLSRRNRAATETPPLDFASRYRFILEACLRSFHVVSCLRRHIRLILRLPLLCFPRSYSTAKSIPVRGRSHATHQTV
ncbi:hypothetical protein BDV96DRAFT_220290 [Lophiotrema nucula]|uniref:Uncharacterized protein n=1 Tax=Lophiotrema nucula TaxID=690887 RepID=A0A6A5YVE9_9PLEO|nr:hypothetical protein BDV96DRAFT_220290 [Lophiotrema nucula]